MTHQSPRSEPFQDELDLTALEPASRELYILRVLHRMHAHPACSQRVAEARRAGVSDEQIVGIQHPATGPFSSKQRSGLAFVDALMRPPEVQDELARPPRSLFSEREIGELVLIVTAYARSGRQRAA